LVDLHEFLGDEGGHACGEYVDDGAGNNLVDLVLDAQNSVDCCKQHRREHAG